MGVRTASTMTTSRPVNVMPSSLRPTLTGESANTQHPLPERLGIVGSGTIARGLAALAARHGPVILCARSEPPPPPRATSSTPTRSRSPATARRSRRPPTWSRRSSRSTPPRPRCSPSWPRSSTPEAILATTTSSLSAAQLGAESGRPERFAALHVFNPVTKMALVELAFPPEASEDTRGALARAVRRARQDRRRRLRHARLRGQPPALPLPVRRRRAARAHRHGRRRRSTRA